MGYAWTRCRRCGRTLKDPASAKAGVGRECQKKAPARVTETVQLMDAIDVLLANGHYLPAMERIEKLDLNLYAASINAGAHLRASTRRLLLRKARQLMEAP